MNLRGVICADNWNYHNQWQGFGCIFYQFRLLIENVDCVNIKDTKSCIKKVITAIEPVIVKKYQKNLVNQGLCKKKLDTRFDTHCIKTGVQLWQREKDSNPHIRSQSPLCYLYTIPLCS